MRTGEASVDVLWDRPDPEDEGMTALVRDRAARLCQAAGAGDRSLSVVLTDDATIAKHNLAWRGVDGPTDVLSFPMDEGDPVLDGSGLAPLGDVVLSLDTAGAQAAAHDLDLIEELTFLLVHGVCHLLGHDHGDPDAAQRMRAEEDRLLAAAAPGSRRPDTPY